MIYMFQTFSNQFTCVLQLHLRNCGYCGIKCQSFLFISLRIHCLSDLSGVTDLTMNKLSQVLKDACSQLADESLSAVLCSCLPSFPSEADWTLKPGRSGRKRKTFVFLTWWCATMGHDATCARNCQNIS